MMKLTTLVACLVTLQITSGQPLQATTDRDYRQWTDTKGRTMLARLVALPDPASVKIERKQDGRVFTVPVSTFSYADQDYVETERSEEKHPAAANQGAAPATNAEEYFSEGSSLKRADASLWTLLNSAGHQPASTYGNTKLELIIEGINQRFLLREVKAPSGTPLNIRTEPADLASRIRIQGDMPRMPLDAFLREIGRANHLEVMIDNEGDVVLVEKRLPKSANEISFLGVPVEKR